MYEKEVLPNGVRIMCEPVDGVRSASVGIWVGVGSRLEPENRAGACHAIEHMLFKGTATRSAAQVAEEMDVIGGQVNAFTTKEITAFYGRSLDTHLGHAIELLGDIFFHPRMDEADWQNERGVIIEEIGMYEDQPEDLVGELLFDGMYAGCSLARPIIGSAEVLKTMTAADLAAFQREYYSPESMVVALAGRYSDTDRRRLSDLFAAMPAAPKKTAGPGQHTPSLRLRQKSIEQNHLCLGYPSLPSGDPQRYHLQVMNGILGAGMSSRLFQTVREKHGLCYSIYSFTAAHRDTGALGIYTAVNKDVEEKALQLTERVIEEFIENGPTEKEVERVREQIKSNVLMGLESTQARMSHLGQLELMNGEVPNPDQIIERYDAVTREGVHALAKQLLIPEKRSFAAVGDVESADYTALLGLAL